MKRIPAFALTGLVLSGLWFSVPTLKAFCGFYVAKADAQLFNSASQVVLVRNEDKTVITMANDFRGDPKEFAMVVPVPTFIERGQINVGDKKLIDHLDAYSSPRLVEYFDDDPCRPSEVYELRARPSAAMAGDAEASGRRARSLGVTVEAEYTVGEYDILILSAKESDGLETWLTENGYRIPPGASRVLGSYIRQNMRFFVAKVNLKEQSELGFNYLRPLQVAYESPKFMLPIRLGTVNSDGPQDLVLYTLTKNGRVETTNYRTVKLPTGMDLPVLIKKDFGRFYKDMFAEQVRKENMRTVFLEYAWDMAWCDPCAADPLSRDELRSLGVFWMSGGGEERPVGPRGGIMPSPNPSPAQNVFVTRLHVRYDGEHFPEDLTFQETGDRSNFQGRYVVRHPYTGEMKCDGAAAYKRQVADRQEQEARSLALLTGWDITEIREKMNLEGNADEPASWWERLWKR